MATYNSLEFPQDEAAKRARDTAAIQARQLASKAPAGVSASQVGQAAAPAITRQEAQTNLQSQQQGAQLAQRVADLDMQGLQAKQQERLAQSRLATEQMSQDFRRKAYELDKKTAGKIFDDSLRREQDEAGREYTNAMDLLEWSAAKGASQRDFDRWKTQATVAHKRSIMLEQVAHSKIMNKLKQESKKLNQEDRQALEKELQIMQSNHDKRISEMQERAANLNSYISAGATLATTGVALYAGAPAGGALLAGTAVNKLMGGE